MPVDKNRLSSSGFCVLRPKLKNRADAVPNGKLTPMRGENWRRFFDWPKSSDDAISFAESSTAGSGCPPPPARYAARGVSAQLTARRAQPVSALNVPRRTELV